MKKSLIFLILSTFLLSSVSHARPGDYWSSKKRKKKMSDYETLTNYIANDIDGDLERPVTFDPDEPNYERSKNIFNFYLIGAASTIVYDRMKTYDSNDSQFEQYKLLKNNMWKVFRLLEDEEKKCSKNEFYRKYYGADAESFKDSNQFAGILYKLMTHSTFQDFYEIAELHGDYSHVPVENRNTAVPRDKIGRENYVSGYYSQISSIKKGKNGKNINVDVEKVRRRHIWEMYKKFFGGSGSDEDIKGNIRRVPNMGCSGYYKDYIVKFADGMYHNIHKANLEAADKLGVDRDDIIDEWKEIVCPKVNAIQKCYQNLMTDLGVFRDNQMEIDGEDTNKDYEYRKNYYRRILENSGTINK